MSTVRLADLPADVRAIIAAALAAEAAATHKPGTPASAVSGEMSASARPDVSAATPAASGRSRRRDAA